MLKLARVLIFLAVLSPSACGPPASNEIEVSPWPLRVPSAELSCDNGRVFLKVPDGSRYAVNGTARAEAPIMDPIQLRYDHDLVQRGLKLCEASSGAIRIVPGREETGPTASASSWAFERDEFNPNALTLKIASANEINGVRPSLMIACDGGESLVEIEYGVIPPRSSSNEEARYKFSDVADWRKARVFENGGNWYFRDESADERAVKQRFVSEALRSDTVVFTAPFGFNHEGDFRWDLSVMGDQRKEIQDRCDGVPVPTPADGYFLKVTEVVVRSDEVNALITTNMPLPVEVSLLLSLQGQGENDPWVGAEGRTVIGTTSTRVNLPRRNASGQPAGQPLPAGTYDLEATFYPRWGAANGPDEAKKIKHEVTGKSLVQLR